MLILTYQARSHPQYDIQSSVSSSWLFSRERDAGTDRSVARNVKTDQWGRARSNVSCRLQSGYARRVYSEPQRKRFVPLGKM
jgi:hypothetical protein